VRAAPMHCGHRNSFDLKVLYDTTLCVSAPDYNDIEVKIYDDTNLQAGLVPQLMG